VGRNSTNRTQRALCVVALLATALFLPAADKPAQAQSANSGVRSSLNARPWPKADRLFRADPRWLGSDAAFSIDLGNGRVLWLFGDSFIADKTGDSRLHSRIVRNSVAIETGYDPARAQIQFFWGRKHGHAAAFATGKGKIWLWPNQGIRLGNHLLLFYNRVAPDPRKNSLGFESAGWTAFLVDNPDRPPSAWKLRQLAVPGGRGSITFGVSTLRMGRWVYVYGFSEPQHNIYLIRWPRAAAAKGDLLSPEWRCGSNWSAHACAGQPILRNVSTEFSVQRDPHGSGFIEVNSQGFGASVIVVRFAPHPEGPWSKAREIYRPPESNRPDAFVYAGKSHPELTGADVVITYATNSMNFGTLLRDMSIGYPRFVRLDLP
jgi:hypothetical protein